MRRSLTLDLTFGLLLLAGAVALIELYEPAGAPDDLQPTRGAFSRPAGPSGRFVLRPGTDPAVWRELIPPAGSPIRLPEPPQRIVSQALATDEILLAICPRERIVALSTLADDPRYSNVVDEATALGRILELDTERILAAEPDLVFLASYTTLERTLQLRSAGLPTLQLRSFDSIDAVLHNIDVVGFALGLDAEAAAMTADMRRRLEALRARIPKDRPAPRVLSYNDGVVAGLHTPFDSVMRAVGARNVAAEAGLSGWPQITGEQVALWDPDYLLLGLDTDIDHDDELRQLRTHPAIAHTRALRRGNLVLVDNRLFLAVSQYIVDFAEQVAAALYGDTT